MLVFLYAIRYTSLLTLACIVAHLVVANSHSKPVYAVDGVPTLLDELHRCRVVGLVRLCSPRYVYPGIMLDDRFGFAAIARLFISSNARTGGVVSGQSIRYKLQLRTVQSAVLVRAPLTHRPLMHRRHRTVSGHFYHSCNYCYLSSECRHEANVSPPPPPHPHPRPGGTGATRSSLELLGPTLSIAPPLQQQHHACTARVYPRTVSPLPVFGDTDTLRPAVGMYSA